MIWSAFRGYAYLPIFAAIMVVLKEIRYLLGKELLLEFRNKTAISGLLLYVVATIYVVYLSFRQVTTLSAWNALFWIIVLFSSFNVAGRSFDKESGGREIYLYTLCSAPAVILSKILFNALLLVILSTISVVIYLILLGSQPLGNADLLMFYTGIVAGSVGFGAILTLVGGIAYKTENNIGLTAVLGFPVILPFLLTLIRFSKNALDGIAWSVNIKYMLVLLFLNLIIGVLAYILFPYLWRD